MGSPTSILFFTQEQLRLWDEKKVLLIADYSTGSKILPNLDIEHAFMYSAQEKRRF